MHFLAISSLIRQFVNYAVGLQQAALPETAYRPPQMSVFRCKRHGEGGVHASTYSANLQWRTHAYPNESFWYNTSIQIQLPICHVCLFGHLFLPSVTWNMCAFALELYFVFHFLSAPDTFVRLDVWMHEYICPLWLRALMQPRIVPLANKQQWKFQCGIFGHFESISSFPDPCYCESFLLESVVSILCYWTDLDTNHSHK